MLFRHLTGFLRNHGRISKGALERSLSTNSGKMDPSRRRCVVSLDPTKFAEKKQQRFDIGDQTVFNFYTMLHNPSSPVTPTHFTKFTYDIIKPEPLADQPTAQTRKQQYLPLPFPPDTKAFLYYSMSPEKPRIAGELRLRLTSNDDPASFESGSDLLKPNGQPWSRPVFIVSKIFVPLYEKLREERLVPDDLDAALSTLPRKNYRYRPGQALYTLNDTFIIDFSRKWRHLTAITEQGIETIRFVKQFNEKRGSTMISPYTGTALVRFERSTLPQHEGTRTVVLRFLKIFGMKCVIPNYDGYIVEPKEGELFRRSLKNKREISKPPVWGLNIDKKGLMTRGLLLLWDT